MLVPLGESASVDDILQKLDGFFGDVATTQTLMQSLYRRHSRIAKRKMNP